MVMVAPLTAEPSVESEGGETPVTVGSGGEAVEVNAPESVEDPPVLLTVTATAPAVVVWGVVTRIVVGSVPPEPSWGFNPGRAPKSTVQSLVKFDPESVTRRPPLVYPWIGLKLVSTGAGGGAGS